MPYLERFKNRKHAGRMLARELASLSGEPGLTVLALPRGGVPVGYAVASALHAELDVLLVRKIGMPGQEEYAIGAVGSGGVRVLRADFISAEQVPAELVEAACADAWVEITRRERLYRGARPPLVLEHRTAVLTDDGLATGASMRAAIEIARQLHPARLVVAVPVGAPDSLAALAPLVDQLICLLAPPRFHAVSQWYDDFDQTGDDEVRDLLAQAWREHADLPPGPPSTTTNRPATPYDRTTIHRSTQ
jgi:putative phosphoribosyl transferase